MHKGNPNPQDIEALVSEMEAKGLSMDDILSEDLELLSPPYKVDQKAKAQYQKVLDLLESLVIKGKFVYSFDDPDKPYELHTIRLKWKDEEDEVEIESSIVAKMLQDMEELILEGNRWHIFKTIYKKTK